jgi:hypothetical protein
MTDSEQTNLFDKIRFDADEKRKARVEQKQKSDEFLRRMRNGDDSLKRINQKVTGELNNEKSN